MRMWLLGIILFGLTGHVLALSRYLVQVPNGDIMGAIGHETPTGGGTRNPFGKAFAAAGNSWTTELCNDDSDNDGQSNGLELGDPDCIWVAEAAPPITTDLSHPGIASNTTTRSMPSSRAPSASPTPPTPTTEDSSVAALERDFTFKTTLGADFDLHWTLAADGVTLDAAFRVKTAGAAAVAIGGPRMRGAAAVIGWDHGVEAFTLGSHQVGTAAPAGTLLDSSSERSGAFLTVRFKQSVAASSGDTTFLGATFATSAAPASLGVHVSYSSATVNLKTGAGQAAGVEVSLISFSVMFGLLAVLYGAALALAHSGLRTSACGQRLLQRRLGFGPDFMFEMVQASLICFVVLCVAFIVFIVVELVGAKSIIVVLGKLSLISMSLTLTPVAKNSVWLHAFGVPYERALKFHKFFSYIAVVAVDAHFIAIMVIGGYDITSITPTSHGILPLFGFLAFVLMNLVLWATLVRRTRYALFRNLHYCMYVVGLLALVHTQSPILIVPYTLLLIDRLWMMMRTVKGEPDVETITGFTVLRLPRGSASWKPGDYAFLTIPEISKTVAHPFTIASAPHKDDLKFVIKNMGPGTWTGKLHEMATAEITLSLQVNWSFGRLNLRLDEHKCLFLAAGGIGITPMAAMLSHLITKKKHYPSLQKVVLLWSTQDENALRPFASLIKEARACDFVAVAIFITRAKGTTLSSSLFRAGRPVIAEVMEDALPVTTDDFENVELGTLEGGVSGAASNASLLCRPVLGTGRDIGVLACGPTAMVNAVQTVAMKNGYHFSRESFLF